MNKQLINSILEDLKYFEKYEKHKVIANRIKLKLNALGDDTANLTDFEKGQYYHNLAKKHKAIDKSKRIDNIRQIYKKFKPFINSPSKQIETERRIVVAKHLRSLGFTLNEIGIAMGKDHSTIHHYLTRIIDDVITHQTELEYKIYLKELL